MSWIAIAATVDNVIIAVHDDITLLNEAAEYDFDVIVKMYGVSEEEYSKLKLGNLSWRIRFNNLRSIYLEPIIKSNHHEELSKIYSQRLLQLINVRGRFEHALNKHKPLLSQQLIIYEAKAKEAKDLIEHSMFSEYFNDGYVKDYAEEVGLDVMIAAKLILTKYNNWHAYLRKLERLRLRHLVTIKKARTVEDFSKIVSAIDKDFFINMLL